MADEHVDAACAWLNIEAEVLDEIAQRDFGIDEIDLAVSTTEPTREYLVNALGAEGQSIYDEFSLNDVSPNAPHRQVGKKLHERFSQASLRLALFLLANQWSVLTRMRQAGATEETFREAFRETATRLTRLVGEAEAERAARLQFEFRERATGKV